ncbi:nicotinate-nucleotide pyrophosphorylase (carboxylating) [gut metagenome]|uniref:Probable nicotinate-nucleotide pyrophosphorylase [carboxylating] n=1 Tax=gut metagenome TaxID=749906 RepID=J9FSQ3_9ZZZZ
MALVTLAGIILPQPYYLHRSFCLTLTKLNCPDYTRLEYGFFCTFAQLRNIILTIYKIMYTVDELNDRLIDLSFSEDIGDGDHTTLCCIPEDAMGKSKLLIKEEGILAGMRIAKEIFHRFDPTMEVEQFMEDGAHVKPGDVAMIVTGKVRSLLQTERLMLNVMQRMSGIATMTAKYVKRLEGTNTRVLDTRKTTPGMRMLEKEAVKIGGGVNHRIGLFDMILLKDNHVDFAGGIANALDRCAAYQKEKRLNLKVEIECRSFDEIRQVMEHGGADRIMLDNFSVEDTKKAVELIDHRFETESSGGITYDTLRDYAECGVDYISVGALTHSVKGLDMSFKAC